jgi:hypothetical protein
MKTSGFNSGVQGALGKLASIGSAAAKITAGIGIAGGVAAGALIAKSIGKAADMETLRTAFVPLLGGIKQARDRMAELSAFAAATPFELPEIAAASKTLETLTRGAMSTGKGLTLVGDVASATNQPFSEIAVTIGRLYDGLQSGRPVGEVMMRLQELGVVSGETRARIEDLQKSGAAGKDTWAVAEASLTRFSGSMKLQSGTWNGLMSTLSDTISAVMVKFGEPIMDSLKPYLEGAISRIESLQAAAANAGRVIGEAFSVIRAAFEGGQMMALAGASLKLGFIDAINTLAAGVRAAMAGAGAALNASGIPVIIESALLGATHKMAQVLKDVMADFADTIGRFDKAKGFREESAAYGKSSAALFNVSKFGMENMLDPAKTAADFVQAFQATFKSAPELIDSAEARKQWTDLYGPIKATADKSKAERDAKADADAAAVVNKAAGASPAAAAAAAAGKGQRPTADRLAQIGGYVGTAAKSMGEKSQELTAKWTQKTAELLQKLANNSQSSDGLTFS